MLKETFMESIKRVNSRIDVAKLKRMYWPNESRTLLMKIIGKNVNIGILVDDVTNEILMVTPEDIQNPTVTAIFSDDTFWMMLMGKITLATSFFDRTHPVALEGDATYRDIKVFTAIERELASAFKDIWGK